MPWPSGMRPMNHYTGGVRHSHFHRKPLPPMSKKSRILAIDPGTREMGVAILENGTLLYAGVETFCKLPSREERARQGRTTVARLIHDFRPAVLAVEKNFVGRNHRHAPLLSVLTGEITELAQRNRVTVVSLAPNTVKKVVAGDGLATKKEVAHAVALRFPKLMAFLPPERIWKRRHHLNMFDAVALGIACISASRNRRHPGTDHPIRAP